MNEKRASFSSININELVYVFGGHNQGTLASIPIERFSINDNKWTEVIVRKENTDFGSLIGASAIAHPKSQTKMLILGGSDGDILRADFFEVNLSTGEVASLAALPDARARSSVSVHSSR